MKNLIAADVKRILRKPSYWIVLGICLMISLFWTIGSRKDGAISGLTFASNQGTSIMHEKMIVKIELN